MAYPFQITSMDQYEMAYRVSVNQPEEFWASVQKILPGEKNGARCLSGILKSRKWNGSGELN